MAPENKQQAVFVEKIRQELAEMQDEKFRQFDEKIHEQQKTMKELAMVVRNLM